MKHTKMLRILVTCLAYALLAACNDAPTQQPESPLPVGTPIPFTTLIGGDQPLATPNAAIEPGVTAIDSLDEALHSYPTYSVQLIQELDQVDFGENIVLFISQGRKNSTDHGVIPKGVYRLETEQIVVYADFLIPGDRPETGPGMMSPYALVVVSRDMLIAGGGYPSFVLHASEVTPAIDALQ